MAQKFLVFSVDEFEFLLARKRFFFSHSKWQDKFFVSFKWQKTFQSFFVECANVYLKARRNADFQNRRKEGVQKWREQQDVWECVKNKLECWENEQKNDHKVASGSVFRGHP